MPHKDREEHLSYVRGRNAYNKKRWVASGLCKSCGKTPRPGLKSCDRCLKQRAERGLATGAIHRQYRARYIRRRQLILAAKSRPCVDCGAELPPEVMDLDHVYGDKEFTFGTNTTIANTEREIAKCEVRCPTCHRLRHYIEQLERERL